MTTLAQIQEAVDAAQQRAPGPRRVRVYISGPIASDPNARQTFAAAQAGIDMRWFGYEAVNPFDIARAVVTVISAHPRHATHEPLSHPGQPCAEGYHPGASDASEHTSSACYMRTDLLALLSCDAIHMLPGWRESKGATVEHAVAVACGMPVTFAAATDGEAKS